MIGISIIFLFIPWDWFLDKFFY